MNQSITVLFLCTLALLYSSLNVGTKIISAGADMTRRSSFFSCYVSKKETRPLKDRHPIAP